MIEVGNCSLDVGASALVPVITAFHVKLIGLWVLCALLGDLLFFSSAQFGAQLVRDVAGYLLLQGDDVRGFALIVLAPDFGVVLNAGEVGADLDRVPVLHHPAGEQGIDGQLLPDLLDVNILALVAEDGVAGFHFQLGHMGEAVDQ